MIVSASRRTDIPACHMPWMLRRLSEGYALAANPYRPKQLARIPLIKGVTDCIVFWSKNPAPLLKALPEVEGFHIPFYIQFTLTPYGKGLEPGLPDKKALIRTFRALSEKLGPERAVWRYDPILIGEGLSVADHLQLFAEMAGLLKGFTRRCIISFLDLYAHIKKPLAGVARPPDEEECLLLAKGLSETAGERGIALFTCSEKLDLSAYGIAHAACIDQKLIESIVGGALSVPKDPGQRPDCGCIRSSDIGAYDTCPLGCIYCYGSRSRQAILERMAGSDPRSPLLCGRPGPQHQISEPAFKSYLSAQLNFD